MALAKLEYIWLDGYKPIQSLEVKQKLKENFSGKLRRLPNVVFRWFFNRTSTRWFIRLFTETCIYCKRPSAKKWVI